MKRLRGQLIIWLLEVLDPILPRRAARLAGWQAGHGGVGFRMWSKGPDWGRVHVRRQERR